MTCPKPEVLSQWTDGSLDPRESSVVSRHAETCAACRRKAEELRAVGAWIASAREPGPSCLSADDMAAVLEGGRVPAHVRTCPRCASEFRALRTSERMTERKGTRRRSRQPAPMSAWAAAAAIFIAVGILLVVANQQTRTPEPIEVRIPTPPPAPQVDPDPAPLPPRVPVPTPKPAIPTTDEAVKPQPPKPPSQPPVLGQPPVPPPVVPDPQPPTPRPAPAQPPRDTVVVAPARGIAALNLRSGGFASMADGKWTKASKIEEGVVLRAEGRTQFDFAQARITLDGASRFSVSKDELSLNEGGMSADVAVGSKFTLLLDEQRIVPQTITRVMFCARPDRVVVEEGSAKIKDTILAEGVEHAVKKDKIEALKRRTLPAAARARESVAWRMDLRNENVVKRNINGHVERDLSDLKMIVSDPVPGGAIFYGQLSYFSTGDEPPLFVVKPNTAIRFRYYLTQPGHLEFVMKNIGKDENFNKTLDPVVKQWTTVTLYARDVLANPGGKKVTCEVGDRYLGVTWFVGRPGAPAEVYIDRFEILEIER